MVCHTELRGDLWELFGTGQALIIEYLYEPYVSETLGGREKNIYFPSRKASCDVCFSSFNQEILSDMTHQTVASHSHT